MKDLNYGGTTFTLGDDVCSAVFAYSLALINSGKADTVSVPALVDGEQSRVLLLLGIAVPLFCLPSPLDDVALDEALDSADTLADLRSRLASYGEVEPEIYQNIPLMALVDEYEMV